MLSTILQIINSFLGATFLFVSLVTIPEIKGSKKNKTLIKIGIAILIFIGMATIYKDAQEQKVQEIKQRRSESANNTLIQSVRQLQSELKAETISRAEFEKQLKDRFHIIKDSANQPKLIYNTFNTNFNKPVQEVKIGDN